MLKQAAKTLVLKISWGLAHAYIRRFKPVIIGVTGSVGKTGTKRAIAHVISTEKRVAWQDGNYNDIVTVPLVFFGLNEPSLLNPFAWTVAFVRMILKLFGRGAEVVVLELGTDGIGQIPAFGNYLILDYAVVTAVSHEHMENFSGLEAVALEELAVRDYARQVYVAESIVQQGFASHEEFLTYGQALDNTVSYAQNNQTITVHADDFSDQYLPKLVGSHQYAALAIAAALAREVGVSPPAIKRGIESLAAMPGRMNVLVGRQGSVLIDDTYNSSPIAVHEALQYLYSLPQKHKIAVLGNMNEMGELSAELHAQVAADCDPKQLAHLVTIGVDANKYLAPAAKKRGCDVMTMHSPYAIGDHLKELDLSDTAILIKGSQNRVFLEETVKVLLQNPHDQKKLVRQSAYWMKTKQKQFGKSA